jgi:hypothetical protein
MGWNLLMIMWYIAALSYGENKPYICHKLKSSRYSNNTFQWIVYYMIALGIIQYFLKNTLKFITVFIYIADYGSANHHFSTTEHR